MRIKVFISGPYTIVDPVVNTRKAIKMWHVLWKEGFAPFCPHTNLLTHFVEPLEYQEWMTYCFEFLRSCDALIRIPGMSEGSDREVEHAVRFNIPVFHNVKSLQKHFQSHPPGWTDSLSDVLHECQDQAVRGSFLDTAETLEEVKKELYYREREDRDQLLKIAALAISALSRTQG